jgi:drug/metabolite transporter (DMT)-like permease
MLTIGMRYMIMSALGFSFMALCVKLSFNAGIPVLEIVAARALVSLILSYVDVQRKGISLLGANQTLLLMRGLVGALALMCVYYAVATLPLAEAMVLQYTHPMFTAILALIFLNERIHSGTFWCVLLSLVGLVLVAKPSGFVGAPSDALPVLSVGLALLGAFGSAVAYVLVRKLSNLEDPSVIIFYFPLIALPLALIGLGSEWVMPQGLTWLWLILVGVFTQVGQVGLTKGMQTETAARATAFSYLQVLFSILLGWFVFAEMPDLVVLLGALLILIGALLNILIKPKQRLS